MEMVVALYGVVVTALRVGVCAIIIFPDKLLILAYVPSHFLVVTDSPAVNRCFQHFIQRVCLHIIL